MSFKKNALQQLYSIASDAVFFISNNGRILYSNPSALKSLKSEGNPRGIDSIMVLMPNFNMRKWGQLWEEMAIKEKHVFQTDFMNKKGQLFPVEATGMMVEMDGEETCLLSAKNMIEMNRHKNMLDLTSSVAKIGHWEWNVIKKEFTLSEGAYHLLGASPKEAGIDNESVVRFLRKNTKEEVFQSFFEDFWEKAFKQGKPIHKEVAMDVDGVSKQFHIHVKPVRSDDDRTINMYGTIQDIAEITERSDQMYMVQTSFEKTSDMIFWVDEKGRFINVNEACCEHTGYSAEELTGMKVFDIESTYDESRWEHFLKLIGKEKKLPVEGFHIRKNKSKYPVEGHATLIEYKNVRYVCAFIRNVEARQKRMQELKSSRYIIDNTREQIIWSSRSGDIIYCNRRFREVMDYSEEEARRLTVFDINPDLTKAIWKEHWEELKRRKSLVFDTMQKTKLGLAFEVGVTANYFELDGEEINCAFIRDISKRIKRQKKLEKLLKQNEQLKNQIKKDHDYLIEEAKLKNHFGEIISTSPNYAKVLAQVERVAKTDTTVLIMGETGTGKELLARAVHETSKRGDKPLVKVNCAALASELIESELFGHEKGAFTGAFRQKIGRFETADRATIFLDEVGEIPLELQPKLLRVLQEGEFQKIGSNHTIKVNTRVIAATNRDLAALVEEGKFREDLFYRLNVFPVINIPLRERREDIPMLLNYFLKKYQEKIGKNNLKISKGDMERLMQYEFPGNVRELENIVERAVILSKNNGVLNVKAVLSTAKKERQKRMTAFPSLEETTRNHILQALERCNWKVTGKRSASELLGLNGQTLYSKMRKLGILENKKRLN